MLTGYRAKLDELDDTADRILHRINVAKRARQEAKFERRPLEEIYRIDDEIRLLHADLDSAIRAIDDREVS